MLPVAMPTIPITDLRTRQPEVLETIARSPVLLTRQGHGAGVLVHPDQWNQIITDLERLKRQRRERHQRIRERMDAGEYVTLEELEAGLKARGKL